MLFGEYQHSLDAKGRVTIPVKFRDELGDKFFVCKGLGDECLFLLSNEDYKRMYESLTKLEANKSLKLIRIFSAGADEVEYDKQGRILIKQSLRDYAKISKDVTIVGTGSRAEIWDTQKWNDYNDAQTQDEIREALEGIVLF